MHTRSIDASADLSTLGQAKEEAAPRQERCRRRGAEAAEERAAGLEG